MEINIKSTIFTQLIGTFGVMLLIYQTGLIDGWSSPNMVRLTKENSTIHLTESEASWLASFIKLGRFMSVFIVPVLIELAGSKNAILYSFIPVSLSWLLIMVAKSPICLYVARFLSGITIGLTYGIYSIYIGEISAPGFRGTFNSIAMIGWPLGTLISTVSEKELPEVGSCTIYLVMCLLGILLLAWLPESPYQLVKNKDIIKARKSLAWYRGHNDTQSEMDGIIEYIESTGNVTFAERVKQLKSISILKALILVTIINSYSQLCGIFNIIFYMETILTNSQSHLVDPCNMVIYTNAILLVVTIFTISLTDKLGRKVVLVFSTSMIMAALIGLGLHYYLISNTDTDPSTIQELPLVSIVILLGAYAIGLSPASGTLLGEMFPAGFKTTAATIVTFFSSIAGFVSTKSYEPLVESIGEAYVFWMYAAFAATAIPLVLFCLPETKGKSLQEIQNTLNKK